MNVNHFFEYAWALFMVAIAAAGKLVWDTRSQLEEHKLYVAGNFVKKDDLKQVRDEIKEVKDDIIAHIDLAIRANRKK